MNAASVQPELEELAVVGTSGSASIRSVWHVGERLQLALLDEAPCPPTGQGESRNVDGRAMQLSCAVGRYAVRAVSRKCVTEWIVADGM